MKVASEVGVNQISVFGDSELIIQQVKDIYQVKNPNLISYRNEVWDNIEKFCITFNITFIPRDLNQLDQSLAKSASALKLLMKKKPHMRFKLNIGHLSQIISNIGRCFKMIKKTRGF